MAISQLFFRKMSLPEEVQWLYGAGAPWIILEREPRGGRRQQPLLQGVHIKNSKRVTYFGNGSRN